MYRYRLTGDWPEARVATENTSGTKENRRGMGRILSSGVARCQGELLPRRGPDLARAVQYSNETVKLLLAFLVEGGLCERARARAQQIAQDADLRMVAPRDFFTVAGASIQTVPQPEPGAALCHR